MGEERDNKPRESRLLPWDELKVRLQNSKFRSRFKMREKELRYLERKGAETIRAHAIEFVTNRIAPATPNKEGKQTPMRGHPVFVAQHATATCCRGCFNKWHKVELGRDLSQQEIDYIVDIIMKWIDFDLERRRNAQPLQHGQKSAHRQQSRKPFASAEVKRQQQQERFAPGGPGAGQDMGIGMGGGARGNERGGFRGQGGGDRAGLRRFGGGGGRPFRRDGGNRFRGGGRFRDRSGSAEPGNSKWDNIGNVRRDRGRPRDVPDNIGNYKPPSEVVSPANDIGNRAVQPQNKSLRPTRPLWAQQREQGRPEYDENE